MKHYTEDELKKMLVEFEEGLNCDLDEARKLAQHFKGLRDYCLQVCQNYEHSPSLARRAEKVWDRYHELSKLTTRSQLAVKFLETL